MAGFHESHVFRPLLALTLASCVCGASHSERFIHFDYQNGGEDWIVGECASRDRQSPIDLDRHAPWECNPPVLLMAKALFPVVGLDNFLRMGGGEILEAMGYGAPAPAPAPASAAMLDTSDDSADADSMLQLATNASAPWIPWLPGGMMRGMRAVYPTAPPSLMFPGCGGPLGAFFFKYDKAEKDMMIQNNGHSIATDLKGHGLGGLVVDEVQYDVLSVNFHVWSEHTFNGKRYPLELHVVHREAETNGLVVLAIPFDTHVPMADSDMVLLEKKKRKTRLLAKGRQPKPLSIVTGLGEDVSPSQLEADSIVPPSKKASIPEPQPTDPGFSEALANLMTFPLPKDGEQKMAKLRAGPADLISPLLGSEGVLPQAFFQYRGSLTAPPCTEQVTWLVRKTPLIASNSQVDALRMAIFQANSNFPNSRSPMPLMGRNIMYRVAVNGQPPPKPEWPTTTLPFGEGPKEPHVDFRGVTEGKEAYARALQTQGGKDRIVNAIRQAQDVQAIVQAGIDPNVVAQQKAYVHAAQMVLPPQPPTPDPDIVLNRMVDAVAEQLDGAERAAALAAAGVVAGAPAPAAPLR
jgi:carbonic anhydrase